MIRKYWLWLPVALVWGWHWTFAEIMSPTDQQAVVVFVRGMIG